MLQYDQRHHFWSPSFHRNLLITAPLPTDSAFDSPDSAATHEKFIPQSVVCDAGIMMIFLPPLPVKNQAMSDVFHPLLLLPMVGWPLLRSSRMRSISIFASPSFGPFDHNPPLLSQVSAIASSVLFSVTSASQPHVFYHYCFFFFIITNSS